MRTAASRADDVAEQVRTKSLGDLLEAGSAYARQNPLVVFGAAAGAGLLLSRFAKSSGQTRAPQYRSGAPQRPRSAQSSAQTRQSQASGGSRAANA
jgi:hypothetical protein